VRWCHPCADAEQKQTRESRRAAPPIRTQRVEKERKRLEEMATTEAGGD
jgi:hypothetical protein